MMIVRLSAQWAFFFHGLAGVLRLSQLLKESSQRPDGQVKIATGSYNLRDPANAIGISIPQFPAFARTRLIREMMLS